MSKESLAKVVQRAISDAGFRRQLNSDPAGALRGFDLSADEVSALRSGNAGRLSTLGVDQRMSKAFAIGGVAATRSAESELTAGNATVLDDGSGAGGRTIIPRDPEAASTADRDGAAGTRSAIINDDPDGFLAANAKADFSGTQTVRTGDDWKFADRAESARAGDDWARAGSAQTDDSGRVGSARLDDASGASSGASVIHDDPDGFLAANANADASGSVVRANVINDDPDGFLAANANADASGGSAGDGTAFLDDSEAYLTRIGNDANAASSAVTETPRGDGPTLVEGDVDSDSGNAASEGGPIDH